MKSYYIKIKGYELQGAFPIRYRTDVYWALWLTVGDVPGRVPINFQPRNWL